jgi:hypothetical protein
MRYERRVVRYTARMQACAKRYQQMRWRTYACELDVQVSSNTRVASLLTVQKH